MDAVNVVQPAYNNAVAFLNNANEELRKAGIVASDGTPAQFSQLASSPAWLFALAAGTIMTEWQERLRTAYSVMNIETCSDEQVLRWATFLGVERSAGSSSYVSVRLINEQKESRTLMAGTKLIDDAVNVVWVLDRTIHILAATDEQPRQEVVATLYTENKGQTLIYAGTSFSAADGYDLKDVTVTATAASVVGAVRETIASLRSRIIEGGTVSDAVLQFELAAKQLSGVVDCKCYFNLNSTKSQLLSFCTLPPRTAAVVIQGVDIDGKLAETFYTYLNVPTVELAVDNIKTFSENYVRGVSTIRFYYSRCVEEEVQISVHVNKNGKLLTDFGLDVRESILANNGTLPIGAPMTEKLVLSYLYNVRSCDVVGADVRKKGFINQQEIDELKLARDEANAAYAANPTEEELAQKANAAKTAYDTAVKNAKHYDWAELFTPSVDARILIGVGEEDIEVTLI